MPEAALGACFVPFMWIDLSAETWPPPRFGVQSCLWLSSLIPWCLLGAEGRGRICWPACLFSGLSVLLASADPFDFFGTVVVLEQKQAKGRAGCLVIPLAWIRWWFSFGEMEGVGQAVLKSRRGTKVATVLYHGKQGGGSLVHTRCLARLCGGLPLN